MNKQEIEIYDSIYGRPETVSLRCPVAESTLRQFADAFKAVKLSGPIAAPVSSQTLLKPEDRNDYADDFRYDAQQFALQVAGKTWEQFGLSEAAAVLGYQHVVSLETWYSAMPFLFELILRAAQWITPFGALVSRLREEGKLQQPPERSSPEFAQAIVTFLELIKERTEGKYETATVAKRAIVLWKARISSSDQG